MKLSEYLHNKMGPSNAITWRARTAEQIEEFLQQWASETRAFSGGVDFTDGLSETDLCGADGDKGMLSI